ncbi:hypothetical protein EV144_10492 [Flavobacterium sp. 270]|uniref:hypothetical protein n=1 Tax=Flavobacterium sp. 270 TaxID=2512114 RepID=UPI001066C0C0|nr:hypothetical protein [Flavobacterium sp. 270]TDW47806.1 hypothetical protein EV144_10492 [Flavobacterium sp. 270]
MPLRLMASVKVIIWINNFINIWPGGDGLIETDALMKLPEADRKRISNTVEIEFRGKMIWVMSKLKKVKKQDANICIMKKHKNIVLLLVGWCMSGCSIVQTKLIPTNNKGGYTVTIGKG